MDELYKLCNEVVKDNPYYPEAQEKAAHLLILRDKKAGTLDEEEVDEEITISIFKHALKSNDQNLIDGMLTQLSDLPIGSLKNVKCDADTIIALAKQIKNLREENAKLTKRLDGMQGTKIASTAISGAASADASIAGQKGDAKAGLFGSSERKSTGSSSSGTVSSTHGKRA